MPDAPTTSFCSVCKHRDQQYIDACAVKCCHLAHWGTCPAVQWSTVLGAEVMRAEYIDFDALTAH